MFPVLFKLGAFEVRSYGLMLALSFIAGIFLAVHRAKKREINPNIVMDLSLVIIISSIVGARFMYVIFHLDEFKSRWLDTINPFQSSGEVGISGMTVIGGLIFATVASLFYLWVKKQPVLKIVDIMVPSIALGIFLTRIGCFLNGCCFGRPGESFTCLIFPSESPAGYTFPNQKIIPTQIYSSLYGLVILLILLLSEKRYHRYDGFTFHLFFMLYGFARFIIDFFRYYEDSMVLLQMGSVSISVNQGISLLFAFLFGGLLIYNKLKSISLGKKP